MDFFELVNKRESCRRYDDKPVEREKIKTCLEAARLAPSACNRQPWKFIVVDEQETVKKLAPCLHSETMTLNKYCEDVPAFVVLVQEKRSLSPRWEEILTNQDYAPIDMGIAAESIVLAATAVGLASCIVGWFDAERVKAMLDIPEQSTPRIVIALGYPLNDQPREKIRFSLDEIVSFNRY